MSWTVLTVVVVLVFFVLLSVAATRADARPVGCDAREDVVQSEDALTDADLFNIDAEHGQDYDEVIDARRTDLDYGSTSGVWETGEPWFERWYDSIPEGAMQREKV